MSHKLAQGRRDDSILLEFELADLRLEAGKQGLKYTSLPNDFNEPFEIWLMYFLTRG